MSREELADAMLSARSGGGRYRDDGVRENQGNSRGDHVRESEGSSKVDKVSSSNTMDKWTKTNTISGYTNTISGLDTLKDEADDDFGMPQQDNDYANAYYFEDDDADNDPELIVVSKKENNTNSNPYQSELNVPVLVVGKTKLGLGKAKLYGLVNDDGELVDRNGKLSNADKVKQRKYLDKMSKPRTPSDAEVLEEIPTFKPLKNKEAELAMRNPRCGYDFVDRLKSRGDFLDRAFGNATDSKKQKKLLESEEADYDAKLDKLACPQCKREQSFLEHYEKRRYCSQCKEKFCKLNIFNPASFERRMKGQEVKRKQGLDGIDDEMYGKTSAAKVNPNLPKPPVTIKPSNTAIGNSAKPLATAPISSNKTVSPSSRPVAPYVAPVAALNNKNNPNPPVSAASTVKRAEAKPTTSTIVSGAGAKKGSSNGNKSDALGQLQQKQIEHQSEILALLNNKTSIQGVPTVDMLSKLAQIQKEKTELLNKAIYDAETKYTSKGPSSTIPLKPKAVVAAVTASATSVKKNIILPTSQQDAAGTKSSATITSNSIKSKSNTAINNKAKENSDNILQKDACKINDDYITVSAIDAEDKMIATKLSKLLY